jgi:hypothetical protein
MSHVGTYRDMKLLKERDSRYLLLIKSVIKSKPVLQLKTQFRFDNACIGH